jgi:HAMP domain-containing protein
MATTARPTTTRSRARKSEAEDDFNEERENQFDLLTAALIGVAIGAGVTLMVRRGPSGQRPLRPLLRAAGKGARIAGDAGLEGARWAGERAVRGARWAGPRAAEGVRYAVDRGGDLIDRIPMDDITEQVRDYVDTARDAINDVVKHELNDLRKAVRRQRKRIGV